MERLAITNIAHHYKNNFLAIIAAFAIIQSYRANRDDKGDGEMKTAYDLLMTAPDRQVKRAQIAFKAVADGQWLDAAHSLRNAANEETGQWANEARELAEHCEKLEAA